MSHITVVINRAAPPSAADASEPEGVTFVSVSFTPPDSMSETDVGHAVRKLYKQVKDLGT